MKELCKFLLRVLGYGIEVAGRGEKSACKRLVEGGYRNKHEGASRPDVQVVRVNREG